MIVFNFAVIGIFQSVAKMDLDEFLTGDCSWIMRFQLKGDNLTLTQKASIKKLAQLHPFPINRLIAEV